MLSAAKKHGKFLVFGMLERNGDKLHNSCVLLGPDGIVGVYRKIHLPFLGIDRFVDRGTEPLRVYDIGLMRVGLHICYDGSFPECVRVLTLLGADLIVLPTNWPPGADTFAELLPNARALENHIYYMAVNRVGEERGFQFIGTSKFCLPPADHHQSVQPLNHRSSRQCATTHRPQQAPRAHPRQTSHRSPSRPPPGVLWIIG